MYVNFVLVLVDLLCEIFVFIYLFFYTVFVSNYSVLSVAAMTAQIFVSPNKYDCMTGTFSYVASHFSAEAFLILLLQQHFSNVSSTWKSLKGMQFSYTERKK